MSCISLCSRLSHTPPVCIICCSLHCFTPSPWNTQYMSRYSNELEHKNDYFVTFTKLVKVKGKNIHLCFLLAANLIKFVMYILTPRECVFAFLLNNLLNIIFLNLHYDRYIPHNLQILNTKYWSMFQHWSSGARGDWTLEQLVSDNYTADICKVPALAGQWISMS